MGLIIGVGIVCFVAGWILGGQYADYVNRNSKG